MLNPLTTNDILMAIEYAGRTRSQERANSRFETSRETLICEYLNDLLNRRDDDKDKTPEESNDTKAD